MIDRAIQVHGSLGYTTDLPLEEMYRDGPGRPLVDGPDEVHKVPSPARMLKRLQGRSTVPTEHVPTRRAEARERFAALLERATANL